MDRDQTGIIEWACREFEDADLGDTRRTTRLVRIAARAAQQPSGRVSDVFASDAERQGAYDFLESPHVDAREISASIAVASIARTQGDAYAFVPVDGSSLSLTDRSNAKDFGKLGSQLHNARGLKLLHSYIVDARGTPCGPCVQEWWTRSSERAPTKARPLREKETRYWLDVISRTAQLFDDHSESTRPWFQLDREADCVATLRLLIDEKHLFTVRAHHNRRIKTAPGEPRRYLRDELARAPRLTTTYIDVPAGKSRRGRRARLAVSVAYVALDLKNRWNKWTYNRALHVVHVREVGTTPRGEKPIEWILFTNFAVQTIKDVELVIYGYSRRWAIEDFHKTWKSGACGVEDTQLRRKDHVIKWATILAAVAARIERLKHLARSEPDRPATSELSDAEIRALIYMKRKTKKRTETITDAIPTIAQAVTWIAEQGGYTGKSSGGPPGASTIARGLQRLLVVAEVFEDLDRAN